ncbi:tail fiber protein [Flavobacterium sp. H4147]|uniref:tail fiber protein n=1 Tax=unclassified Flavobacterium TaxID=196869 RepID=UPI0023EA8C10|nr:tail fiber protein [Flavobacterium sp. H4147]
MKKILLFTAFVICQITNSQTFSTNLTPVGWEHNILFNAGTRYTVTQQGPTVSLPMLFDGSMNPYYISGVTPANPAVILIEGLPGYHTQAGAWVGWTTRYLPSSRFKIEGYDTYNGANVWRIIADYSDVDYGNYSFSLKVPVGGAYTKLKFTFYNGQNGTVGLSELFFIHPEATTPYSGLLSPALNNWKNISGNVVYDSGNVGVGTTAPDEKLTVKGKIHAQEVRVDMLGPLVPDYVFANDYKLQSLEQVENYINENKHLPEIPSAQEIEKNGLMLAEMNMSLLKKIEELTLYVIKQNKEIETLKKQDENTRMILEKVQILQMEVYKLKTK